MHRTTALKKHFIIILIGIVLSLIISFCLYFLKKTDLAFSISIFGLIIIPFLIGGAIYLIKFRKNLVVPKYPRDKRLNKTIKNLPYWDFGLVIVILFIVYNLLVKKII